MFPTNARVKTAVLGIVCLLLLFFPLAGRAEFVQIGTGTGISDLLLATASDDARTQSIYLVSDLGVAKRLTGLSIDVATLPGQVMNNFTIRIKHTTLSAYATASWEGPTSGWTVVYQGNVTVSATGWNQFVFTTPFDYNEADNLMVDISFNNAGRSTSGTVRVSQLGSYRCVYARVNSTYGDPLNWNGTTSPTPTRALNLPNARFTYAFTADTDGDGLSDIY